MRLLRFQIRATVKFSSGLDYLVSSGTAGRGVLFFAECRERSSFLWGIFELPLLILS